MAELSVNNALETEPDDNPPFIPTNSDEHLTIDDNQAKSAHTVIHINTNLAVSSQVATLGEKSMCPNPVDNNYSPYESAQVSGGNSPVTYLPSAPKYDPTGLYSDEFRKHIGGSESLLYSPVKRAIPIPPKQPPTGKGTSTPSIMKLPDTIGKGTIVDTSSKSQKKFLNSHENSIDQPPVSPTLTSPGNQGSTGLLLDVAREHSIREQLSASQDEREVGSQVLSQASGSIRFESPPPAQFSSARRESFAVNNTQAFPQSFATSTRGNHGNEKSPSKYRRRQVQAALRKARFSNSGSPEDRQEEEDQTRPRTIGRRIPAQFDINEHAPITPSSRRMRSPAPSPASFAPRPSYSAPGLTDPLRRLRSPSPIYSIYSSPQYSPLRSPEHAPSARAAPQKSRGNYRPGETPRRPSSSNYGYYDKHNNWIHTPRVPVSRNLSSVTAEDFDNPDLADEDEDNDDLFVSPGHNLGPSAKKPRLGEGPHLSTQDRAHHEFERPFVPERRNSDSFTVPAGERRPSRYSGVEIPWGLNQDPVMVDQSEVSDASLKKRGLTRGESEKVCKRGYGANDPENIQIVNLKENNKYTFAKIAEILNEQRIASGRQPSMTACGVTSRYNRTAPLLFAAQGKAFVPLSKRRRGRVNSHGHSTGKPAWTPELDELLVDKVKGFEQSRWPTIARLMQGITGLPFDAESVAHRHTML